MSRGAFQSPKSQVHLPLRSTLGAVAAGDPCSRKPRDSCRLLGRVKLNLAVNPSNLSRHGLIFCAKLGNFGCDKAFQSFESRDHPSHLTLTLIQILNHLTLFVSKSFNSSLDTHAWLRRPSLFPLIFPKNCSIRLALQDDPKIHTLNPPSWPQSSSRWPRP